MSIIPGLVGPKARAKAVADGQQVDIPVPALEFVRQDESLQLIRTYDLSCANH